MKVEVFCLLVMVMDVFTKDEMMLCLKGLEDRRIILF